MKPAARITTAVRCHRGSIPVFGMAAVLMLGACTAQSPAVAPSLETTSQRTAVIATEFVKPSSVRLDGPIDLGEPVGEMTSSRLCDAIPVEDLSAILSDELTATVEQDDTAAYVGCVLDSTADPTSSVRSYVIASTSTLANSRGQTAGGEVTDINVAGYPAYLVAVPPRQISGQAKIQEIGVGVGLNDNITVELHVFADSDFDTDAVVDAAGSLVAALTR